MHIPEKIISGGQTGADLGGLVGARRMGIPTGGNAPRGYKTEKGEQPDALRSFGLVAHPSADYRPRTEENVKNSQATLILSPNAHSSGTELTVKLCEKHNKPYLLLDPFDGGVGRAFAFLNMHKPSVLNIAGNRESSCPGLASRVAQFIQLLFEPKPEPSSLMLLTNEILSSALDVDSLVVTSHQAECAKGANSLGDIIAYGHSANSSYCRFLIINAHPDKEGWWSVTDNKDCPVELMSTDHVFEGPLEDVLPNALEAIEGE